jgi:PAS domain S-box-containing protein
MTCYLLKSLFWTDPHKGSSAMKSEQEPNMLHPEVDSKPMTNISSTQALPFDPILYDEMEDPQRLFRTLFEQVAVAIACVGLDGRFLCVNQRYCDLVGYTAEELLSRTVFSITHPDDIDAALSALEGIVDGNIQSYTTEKRYIRKDGSYVWVQLTSSPIRDSRGIPKYCISICHDITERRWAEVESAQLLTSARPPREERRAAESALREANSRMDEFLSIASHELKSPLTVVRGNIQLAERYLRLAQQAAALEEKKTLDTVTNLLRLADQQVSRINRLVADLLDLSRIQAGKMNMRLSTWNLVSIVHAVVEEQRIVHPQRVFHVEMPAEAITVTVDADRIGQVLTNYLSNAVKYSPAEKPIEIGLHVQETTLRVSVRDQGPGLPPDQHEHIWERFHQVHGIQERGGVVSGLGLGLHISKMIIEQHHGRVGIESVPGKGATFWFDLPFSRAASN